MALEAERARPLTVIRLPAALEAMNARSLSALSDRDTQGSPMVGDDHTPRVLFLLPWAQVELGGLGVSTLKAILNRDGIQVDCRTRLTEGLHRAAFGDRAAADARYSLRCGTRTLGRPAPGSGGH